MDNNLMLNIMGVSADEAHVPDNVDNWVGSSRLRRPLQISPSLLYIMLTDEDEPFAL